MRVPRNYVQPPLLIAATKSGFSGNRCDYPSSDAGSEIEFFCDA
jgi:hypothetical protein